MNQKQAETTDTPSNAFVHWLANHRQGNAGSDVGDGLRRVTEQVVATGRPGKISLTITIKPATKGLGGAFVVEDEIKLFLPKPDKTPALYFLDENLNLVRENPLQLKMDLKPLPTPEAVPMKEIKAAANS